ncbi:FAD-dependent oxidoreductase [Tessaracoccus terricola]
MKRHGTRPGDHVLVVGLGPVAVRLVDELLPEVAAGRLRLTVIGEERRSGYNRVLVGEYAVGRYERAGLDLVDETAWRAAGVRVLTGHAVSWIDRSSRVVHLAPGAAVPEVAYDVLVLAVGARANVPNLLGINPDPAAVAHLPRGVTVLRTPDDGDQLRREVARGGRVVVLGGGVLGLELALAAHEEGCRVTVVHHRPWLLTRSSDRVAGAMLEQVLAAHGVEVLTDCVAREVLLHEDRSFAALALADHRVLAGDLLVLACGTTPRKRIAQGAGLRTDKGILVNHDLEADTEGRVFAIGDCAEVLCTDHTCTICPPRRGRGPAGLVGPGWQQAEWLARRLRHELDEVTEPLEPLASTEPDVIRLKARAVSFAAGGEIDGEPWDPPGSGRTVALWAQGGAGCFAKIVVRDERLAGFIALGLPRAGAELAMRYADGTELPADLSVLLRLDGPDAEAPAAMTPETTICRCAGVRAGAITAAVEEGARSVDDICAATRAGSGCGGCRSVLRELLGTSAVECP